MELKEFYERIGGNYQNIISRLGNEDRIKKYLKMFVGDESFSMLEEAILIQDEETIFRSVHTLKGLAANLSLDKLFEVASNLTEIFRNYDGAPYEDAYQAVRAEYKKTIDSIKQID